MISVRTPEHAASWVSSYGHQSEYLPEAMLLHKGAAELVLVSTADLEDNPFTATMQASKKIHWIGHRTDI